jgi:hypothetical protein
MTMIVKAETGGKRGKVVMTYFNVPFHFSIYKSLSVIGKMDVCHSFIKITSILINLFFGGLS